MRHHMCLEPNSWISQLINFFDVDDYSIPGYQARDVMTQIHLHLWDCAIDYRWVIGHLVNLFILMYSCVVYIVVTVGVLGDK